MTVGPSEASGMSDLTLRRDHDAQYGGGETHVLRVWAGADIGLESAPG